MNASRSAAGRSRADLKVASARAFTGGGRAGGFGGPDGRGGGGGGGIGVAISAANAKLPRKLDHSAENSPPPFPAAGLAITNDVCRVYGFTIRLMPSAIACFQP